MLVLIAGGIRVGWFNAFWAFLLNEANQKALALIGGFLFGVWTIGWAIFNYFFPPKPNEAHQGDAQDKKTQRTLKRSDQVKRQGRIVVAVWASGAVVILALGGALYAYLHQNTVTAEFRVCRGEFQNQCGPHDVFIQCGDPNAWAINTCVRFTQAVLSSRDGNKCGYTVIKYTCSQRLP